MFINVSGVVVHGEWREGKSITSHVVSSN
jgi:hypothetical protein